MNKLIWVIYFQGKEVCVHFNDVHCMRYGGMGLLALLLGAVDWAHVQQNKTSTTIANGGDLIEQGWTCWHGFGVLSTHTYTGTGK